MELVEYLKKMRECLEEEPEYHIYVVTEKWIQDVQDFIDEYGFDELPVNVKIALGYKWDIETEEWYLDKET